MRCSTGWLMRYKPPFLLSTKGALGITIRNIKSYCVQDMEQIRNIKVKHLLVYKIALCSTFFTLRFDLQAVTHGCSTMLEV